MLYWRVIYSNSHPVRTFFAKTVATVKFPGSIPSKAITSLLIFRYPMWYVKKSTKFQSRENGDFTANNRPSVPTKRNIGYRRNYRVSPPESLRIRNVPNQIRRRLLPASPLSPLHNWSFPTSYGWSNSCR